MKLEAGKWYLDRINQKWTVDYCGCYSACGHSESGGVLTWFEDGRVNSGFDSQNDLISEWTELKLRPWKPHEVPLGAWLTMEWKTGRYLITGAKELDLVIGGSGGIGYEHARDTCKYSTDGGKTWLPCGVKE